MSNSVLVWSTEIAEHDLRVSTSLSVKSINGLCSNNTSMLESADKMYTYLIMNSLLMGRLLSAGSKDCELR